MLSKLERLSKERQVLYNKDEHILLDLNDAEAVQLYSILALIPYETVFENLGRDASRLYEMLGTILPH